ncbi:hypothetical protein ACIG5E_23950 [Kitasatospora sp. NPDC053057]|uniref:hypothetical protein n=1 Tax=Kitasatospora sp. NPDC053057 TaxID=3364062 RepID=UPI0037C65166
MSESLPAQPGYAVEAEFVDRSGAPRAEPVRGRVRPSGRVLVALAGVAWLPWAADGLWWGNAGAWFWGLFSGFLGATVLPLAVPREPGFRRACLTVGWLQLAIEAVCSAPYLLIPLPVFVFAFPSGVMLLLTGRRNRGSVGTVLAALLAAGPIGLLAHGGWTHI